MRKIQEKQMSSQGGREQSPSDSQWLDDELRECQNLVSFYLYFTQVSHLVKEVAPK